MTLAIITHATHFIEDKLIFSYGPYVREMNIWGGFANEIIVVAPLLLNNTKTPIDLSYKHSNIQLIFIKSFDVLTIASKVKAFIRIPMILFQICKVMRKSDHIHLRCPGNIGLLGCIAQIFFPNKTKTAKYAGNWDSKSKQPFTYRLQKKILSNTFLTKNMKVLVYGEWQNQTKNIKPFFTATYRESDKTPVVKRNLHEKIRFVFAGTLSMGKRPMYALKLIESLHKKGCDVHFDLYGEGVERKNLETYISANGFSQIITLHGNQNEFTVRNAYQKAHFLVLPSQSEGWPKVVAEAMFWGCVPISSAVSCVPNMLDSGNRGILLTMELEKDVASIYNLLRDDENYFEKAFNAEKWSRNYTLDTFEAEIKKLLQS